MKAADHRSEVLGRQCDDGRAARGLRVVVQPPAGYESRLTSLSEWREEPCAAAGIKWTRSMSTPNASSRGDGLLVAGGHDVVKEQPAIGSSTNTLGSSNQGALKQLLHAQIPVAILRHVRRVDRVK